MFLRSLCRLCCSSVLSSRLSSSLCSCSSVLSSHPPFRQILRIPTPNFTPSRKSPPSSFSLSSLLHLENPEKAWLCIKARNFSISHGTLSLVISPEGQPKFETHEIEPPKKEKWQTKKRLKLQRKREKRKRKAANKRDPRRLSGGMTKRQRFVTAEERIKYKLERARIKEGLLMERLKKYEVPKAQGPVVEPHTLTGEERFYMKKMAQKRSNYVPVGRRGIFGGVILNMHLHWKKHETVKVICKPCKPGQVQEFADEIARLSGGIPIQIIGDDTIVFYRGKNYVQPKVMSPIDTLSKKRALEKSKYEQSLESVRRFIAIAEKELELYYRHVALYGDPNDRDPKSILDKSGPKKIRPANSKTFASFEHNRETDFVDHEISELEDYSQDDEMSSRELDHEGDDFLGEDIFSSDEGV